MWTQASQHKPLENLGDCRRVRDWLAVPGRELSSPAFFSNDALELCFKLPLETNSVTPACVILLRDADMHNASLLSKDGWLAVCLSHAGIISKRIKISLHFFSAL